MINFNVFSSLVLFIATSNAEEGLNSSICIWKHSAGRQTIDRSVFIGPQTLSECMTACEKRLNKECKMQTIMWLFGNKTNKCFFASGNAEERDTHSILHTCIARNSCDPNPCQNGKICIIGAEKISKCTCKDGSEGEECATKTCIWTKVADQVSLFTKTTLTSVSLEDCQKACELDTERCVNGIDMIGPERGACSFSMHPPNYPIGWGDHYDCDWTDSPCKWMVSPQTNFINSNAFSAALTLLKCRLACEESLDKHCKHGISWLIDDGKEEKDRCFFGSDSADEPTKRFMLHRCNKRNRPKKTTVKKHPTTTTRKVKKILTTTTTVKIQPATTTTVIKPQDPNNYTNPTTTEPPEDTLDLLTPLTAFSMVLLALLVCCFLACYLWYKKKNGGEEESIEESSDES